MSSTNENPRASRGRETIVWADNKDPITAATLQETSNLAPATVLLTRLSAEFSVFREHKPLAIGIRAATHAAWPGVTHKAINRVLAMHCRSDNYLQALAAGGPRFDLCGAPSGEVSEEHRAAAALVLARRAEKSVKPSNPPRSPVASIAPPLPLLRLAKTRSRA